MDPYPATVVRRDTFEEVVAPRPEAAAVWIVARADDTAVFFDEARDSFGLASPTAEGLSTFGVYGDLVGTFMAM